MSFELTATLVFLSVGFICFLIGVVQHYSRRCSSKDGKHNWKRIGQCNYGDNIPHTIELHLKCESCGKEIKKCYNI